MARTVAAILGAAYLAVGVVGYLVEGALLGLFEANDLLNLVHVVIGGVLVYGATSTATAIRMSRRVGASLVVIGALGFFTADGFGVMPLGGNNIWLHLSSGAVLLANGVFETDDAPAV